MGTLSHGQVERLLSSIQTLFAPRDNFPALSFVVMPLTLARFRLFR